ncbi:MAG TPA: ABC transporter ATP-binding protein [Candidatus Nanoarchaeia archaeon]|nr:ABC transporter ATP-binding protein [Candidatus Nanoarchaeia archaeon]
MSQNPIFFLIKRQWLFAGKARRDIIIYSALFLLAHTFYFFEPLVIGRILNIIQNQGLNGGSVKTILPWLFLIIGLTIAFWLFHGPARVLENKTAFLVRANYKKYMLDGTMRLPSEWHTDHHSGDTIDKINKASDALYFFCTETFMIIETVTKLLGSYLALVYLNVHASYIVLIIVIVTILMILRIDRTLIRQYEQLFRAENTTSAKIFDVISNITTVIILRVEKLVSSAIFQKIMHPFRLFVKNNKINEVKWFLTSVLGSIMIFWVLLSFVYLNIQSGSAVMLGTVFILYEYVQRINNLFFRFAYKYGDLVLQKTALVNAEEISNEFSRKKRVKQFAFNRNWRLIEVRNLLFSYRKKDKENANIDSISFSVRRGERIALIGASGSGKTTALKLIRDLYHPKSVSVLLDGQELPHGFKSISEEISLIPQDPEIFSTTIKENITLGARKDEAEILKYTDTALFTPVIRRLPRGLRSSIVEKGVNLSGGEKQRLALARGLIASEGKSIILLDEPTSSVDARNELQIYKNIFDKFKDKAILSSIHRLHLLSLFDKVLLFKEGVIIASGSFNELLAASAEFKDMWEKYVQSQKKR